MTPAMRRFILTAFLLISVFSLKGQNDSLVVDSITGRIKEILDEYNSHSIYVDTSDYVDDRYIADDLNLQTAASHGACNEIIRLYVKGADVNNFIGRTATPLHYAVNSGKWEAVEILLLLGADPEKRDMYGNTPLITAVRGNFPVIAEKLIRYGGSVTETDRHNSSPLHHAAALGNFYIADLLLYYDSPTELYDREGNTPLMNGVYFGYHDIADLLLQSGASCNAADRLGFTPLMAASQNGDTLMMRLLTDAGANLYAVNEFGLDALGCAIISSEKEAVAFLLEKGNRWNKETRPGLSAIELAERYGTREIVSLLNDHGLRDKSALAFSEISASASGWLSTHYWMSGGSVTIEDPVKRIGITFGAALNPLDQSLLVRKDDDIIYQYQVRSNVIYAGVQRDYPLSPAASELRLTFVPSLSLGYRFHSLYQGTEERPDNGVCIMPAADMRITRRSFSLSAGVSYLNMPFYRVSPVWLTFKASYQLTRSMDNFSGKKSRLYRYNE